MNASNIKLEFLFQLLSKTVPPLFLPFHSTYVRHLQPRSTFPIDNYLPFRQIIEHESSLTETYYFSRLGVEFLRLFPYPRFTTTPAFKVTRGRELVCLRSLGGRRRFTIVVIGLRQNCFAPVFVNATRISRRGNVYPR